MAAAIKLVAVLDVLPALFRFDEGVVSVEVAVGLLGGRDFVDDSIRAGSQVNVITVFGERIGDALDYLVNIAVVVQRALVFAFFEAGGDGEIADAAGALALE